MKCNVRLCAQVIAFVLCAQIHFACSQIPIPVPPFPVPPFPAVPAFPVGPPSFAQSFEVKGVDPKIAQPLQSGVAIEGQPFGVVTIDVPLPPNGSLAQPRILIDDADGRIFYPSITVREIEVTGDGQLPRPLLRGALFDRLKSAIRGDSRRSRPVAITVAALFRGSAPINLHLVGDIDQRVSIPTVKRPDREHRELLQSWWQGYTANAQRIVSEGDHPIVVQQYLTSMLAERFALPRVALENSQEKTDGKDRKPAEPLGTLALLSAIEPLRNEILEQVLAEPVDVEPASLPLPSEPSGEEVHVAQQAPETIVEPLAMRVPAECFYLRFGSFANYLWFNDISTRRGGDLAQLALLRGFNYETTARLERMLNTKLTFLSKLVGDKIINDMAIIGRDMYLKEGAALGVLFSANNGDLLVTSLAADRQRALKEIPGTSLQQLDIRGKQVSLLSTPDNRVRSFLIQDGQFVLVTTSRSIADRFIEVGQGARSLGASPAFRAARSWMPEANKYSVFAYFSPEFFRGLISPQYQIELRRRLEAIAHIEIAEAASMAARAEGHGQEDIQSLKRARLVPQWFDLRADGSQLLRSVDQWIDSRRGARGSFIPIADTRIDRVTVHEAKQYGELAEFYHAKWQQMDPLLIGLRRFQSDKGPHCERVTLEAFVAPLVKPKYGWIASLLGPASRTVIETPADDIASIQLHMRGTPHLKGQASEYHLFSGVKDVIPPAPDDVQGLIRTIWALKSLPAYLGAWPRPGYLDWLPLGIGANRSTPDGFSRLLLGLWRWQSSGFSVLSFDRSVLDRTIGSLQPTESDDAAQVRLRVDQLQGSQLASWVNNQSYQRALQTSQGNARLLDSLHQQLKVAGPETLSVAESLLNVKLQCALEGEYAFAPCSTSQQAGWWTSSAWSNQTIGEDGRLIAPPDYSAPWLEWFRGGKVHLTQLPDGLAVVGSFDLEFTPVADQGSSQELPNMNFDLFQLPMKIFGDQAKGHEQRRKF